MPTYSVRPSRFSERKFLGDGRFSPIRGVSPAPSSTGSHQVAPVCGASVQEPLSESFKFSFVRSISVPRVMGKCVVHHVETPYLVRLKLPLGGHLVSQGLPFETDPPTAFIP